MTRFLTAAVAVAVLASAGRADLAEGYWRFSEPAGAVSDTGLALLKVEKKDGKLTATVVDTLTFPPQKGKEDKGPTKLPVKVADFSATGDAVSFTVVIRDDPSKFQATIDPKSPTVVRGPLIDDEFIGRGKLTAQKGDKLAPPAKDELPKVPDEVAEIRKMSTALNALRIKANQTKSVDDKAELQEKIKAASKEFEEKAPGLYRGVIKNSPDSPYAVDAASSLVRTAGKAKATPAEAAVWMTLIETEAARYGPLVAGETALRTAEALVKFKDVAPAVAPVAEKVAGGLTDTDPLKRQFRALRTLRAAQAAAGKADPAVEARLAKVDAAMDAEYKEKVPAFKPAPYAGRKDKAATRVVVMELFTGAQCPPCVAADVAFDALEKAYAPKDLVLIQYHLHIPGPDPLVNPGTVARYDYYREKFPKGIGGTPSVLFNGLPFGTYDKDPRHGGGGPMSNAKNKFDQYKAVIDPLLEQKSDVTVTGGATATADKVTANVAVAGLPAPARLHVLLVEDSIKYVGGNGLRFHHQVVRAVPTGAKGLEVKDKEFKQEVAVNLAEVKAGLVKYLDEYAVEDPFPYTDRPMDLKHLKVIALVQNEESGEILNAVQMDVK